MRHFRAPILLSAMLAACAPSGQGQAQQPPVPEFPAPTRVVPSSVGAMKMSFAPVVKRSAPAVVNISSKRLVRQQIDPFWELFGLGAPQGRVEGSLGSGVIVRSDGVIVTNNHVIEGGQEITVSLADRREFPARVLLADPRTDLAVLKIDPGTDRLPTLAINDTGQVQVGDLVLAIGDPFGVGQTVTNGIISALNRSADPSGEGASAYIQTDAAINPGNSGGALVDMNGDLIGINSFIVSRSGGSVGVGFAIPAALVKRVVETAAGGGHALVRPWLGAKVQPVTAEIARSLGLPAPHGVLVADVWPGGAASKAGLRSGDLILALDGRAIDDQAGLNGALSSRRLGETLPLTIRRDEVERALRLRAESAPSEPSKDERVLTGRHPLQGATVVNLSPAVADALGLDPFVAGRGVMISDLQNGLAARVGLRPGDIVRQINGSPVATVRELAAILGHESRNWTVTILRDGQEITARLRV